MDDTYTTLTVVSVDGSELVFDQVFKDMSIERFKRAVCMRKHEPADAWEDLKLFVNRQEMENARTLESYNLASGGIIQAVTSDGNLSRAPSRAANVAGSIAGTRAASVRSPPPYLQQPTPIRPPTFPPQPTFNSPKTLRTVFITDENGRIHSLNEVPLDLDISDFQNLVGQKTGFDAASLRIIFGGKQFQPGEYIGRDCLSRINTFDGHALD
jgi:Ubiquitin family